MKATTTDPKWEKKTWEWTKDFTVKADDAKKFNQQAINDATAKSNWTLWLILSSIFILLIIIIFFFLLLKRKKRQKEVAAELLIQKRMLEQLLAMADD